MPEKKIIIIILLIIALLLFVVSSVFQKKPEEDLPEDESIVSLISNAEETTVYIGERGPFVTPQKTNIPPGNYNLWAFKEDYYIIEKNIEIGKEDKEIVLNLEKVPEEFKEDDDFEPQEIDPYPY